MAVSEKLRQAIREWYNAEDVKVVSNAADGAEEVFAYGMLPDTTVLGWFPLGDLDVLEEKLRAEGELE
jgi:hypothetical protein